MNKNIPFSRKGGATINGKFYPTNRASQIIAKQLEDHSNKLAHRRAKRYARKVSRGIHWSA